MKKIIALLLCAIVVLSMFAGCDKQDAANDGTKPQEGGSSDIAQTEKAGSLVVTANASVIVSYGTDGLVLSVEGANEEGKNLMESFEELLGSSCSTVVSRIIRECAGRTYMGRLSYVAIKHEKGSGAPGTNFLEGIETAAKDVMKTSAPDAKLVMITQDMLDADGNIDLKTAKVLVESFLEVEAVDGFDGTDKPVDGFYSFKVSFDGMEEDLHMNAATGVVSEGAVDGAFQDPEETAPTEETEPAESEPVETPNEETPAPSEGEAEATTSAD